MVPKVVTARRITPTAGRSLPPRTAPLIGHRVTKPAAPRRLRLATGGRRRLRHSDFSLGRRLRGRRRNLRPAMKDRDPWRRRSIPPARPGELRSWRSRNRSQVCQHRPRDGPPRLPAFSLAEPLWRRCSTHSLCARQRASTMVTHSTSTPAPTHQPLPGRRRRRHTL